MAVAGGALDLSLGAKLTFSGTTAIDASRNGSFANLSFSGTGPYTTTGCASISGTVINTTGCGGSGSGTVTSVATTGPITGGTITSTGTIDCPTCVTVLGGGTLTAGTGVSLSGSTLSIGQNVSTSSAVSFNQVTTSSYVQAAYFQVPGYIFVDGSANITANSYHIGATPGYTGSTCSAWQSGLCVAP